MTPNPILTFSAAEIARQIRAKTLNPVEVVEAHIQRIIQVNPQINAVVTTMFDSARAQAQQAAELLVSNDDTSSLPPLFGVPITIKDSWALAGVRFTSGSWHHRDDIAADDAPAVKRLKDAGAIILGKTNCPDMCWSGETVNPVFGRTRNPRSLKHMVGGSSGGEGAIIAAGGSPLGLGSDIAGSVRIPAAACGIVSLKPTGGRVPNEGHLPVPPDAINYWNNAGPMARRVEDLTLALRVLSRTPVTDPAQIDLSGRKAIVYYNNPLLYVSRRVKDALLMSAGALAVAGMDVQHDNPPPMTAAGFAYVGRMYSSGGAMAFENALGGGERMRVIDELRRMFSGEKAHISPEVLFNARMMTLLGQSQALQGWGGEKRLANIRDAFLQRMPPGSIMLTPLLTTVTPRHGWNYWLFFGSLPFTFMFNALGFPAVVVPVGWTANGLPLVVQIVARPDEDEVALAVAMELERVFGGWKIAAM